MRMDPRYDRVREMMTAPEIPRFSGGGIALCHWCQRQSYFDQGFLPTLVKDLKCAAIGRRRAYKRHNADYDPRVSRWERILDLVGDGVKVSQIAQDVGVADSTVYDVLRKAGLSTPTQLRKKGRRVAKLEAFGRDRAEKVASMRMGGQSWNAIAASMGEKKETVLAAFFNLRGAA